MIRVAITEPCEILRWALREALSKVVDFEIVGDAGTAASTLEMVRATRPDVLLLDMTLPDHVSADILVEMRELDGAPLVLLFASSPMSEIEAAYAARALAAGAHGYIDRSATPVDLVNALRAVSRGERCVPLDIETVLAASDGSPANALTHRELQVMELIACGMTNAEIGENLGISVKTVDTHRGHVLKKLRIRNNADLTRFAVKHGYVALD